MQFFLDIGFKNFISTSQILVILNPNSQPAVRLVKDAKNNNSCLDVKQGRKTRSVFVLNTNKIIISAISTKTIKKRYLEHELNTIPLLEIGFENYILPKMVSVILNPSSQPTVNLIRDAKNNNSCFDVRQGRKTKSVIVLNTGEIILSTIEPKTIKNRYENSVRKIATYGE